MNESILVFIACICFIFLFGKIFLIPLKYIFKLIANSILGGIILLVINFLLSFINIHIGFNIITSIIVGLLGIPGALMLVIIKLIF